MFQDGSGGVPTDSPQTRKRPVPPSLSPDARLASTASSEGRSIASGDPGADEPRQILGPPTSELRRVLTPTAETSRSPSSPASRRQQTGRGALPGESAHPAADLSSTPSPHGSQAHHPPTRQRVEFPGPTLRVHPFTSKRFHVLLNSLFKVLFNFPSRYLSAIGLVSVFSLRWSLPPALGCIPKQPDSKDALSDGARRL